MTNQELTEELEDTREIARLLYKWAYWLDREMNDAFCICSMEELEERKMSGIEEYEKWRRVRESGLGNKHPWLKG